MHDTCAKIIRGGTHGGDGKKPAKEHVCIGRQKDRRVAGCSANVIGYRMSRKNTERKDRHLCGMMREEK